MVRSQCEDASSKIISPEQKFIALRAVHQCSKGNGCYIGLYVDLQTEGCELLSLLQGDDTNCSSVPRLCRDFLKGTKLLSMHAMILSRDASPHTMTRLIVEQM